MKHDVDAHGTRADQAVFSLLTIANLRCRQKLNLKSQVIGWTHSGVLRIKNER